jgi:hypothetical protein
MLYASEGTFSANSSVIVMTITATDWTNVFATADAVSGSVSPMCATTNVATELGFTTFPYATVDTGIEIIGIDRGGTNTVYYTKFAHGLTAGTDTVSFLNLLGLTGTYVTVAGGTTRSFLIANLTLDLGVGNIVEALFTGVNKPAAVYRVNSADGARLGTRRVDLNARNRGCFVRVLVNGSDEVGSIKSAKTMRTYLAKIPFKAGVNNVTHATMKTDFTGGMHHYASGMEQVRSVRIQLYDDSEDPYEMNGLNWSTVIEFVCE